MAQIKKDTSLRKAILQAAITGQLISNVEGESLPLAPASKLSSATPSAGASHATPPETGKELLDKIIEERNNKLLVEWEEALRKNPKAKKPVPVVASEIDEEETPFEIPENWCWCRWGELSESIQYGYNAPAKESGRIKMVRITDIQNGKVQWDTVPFCEISEEEIKTYRLRKNDILFARTGGTVGKSFLVDEEPENAVYAGYLIRTQYNSEKLNPKYMKMFMESQLYWDQLKNGTIATAQPNCNGQTLSKMILPLPPLAVQNAIVAKLEQVLPLVDAYENALLQKEELKTALPDKVKKAILQEAITGQLTEAWRKSANIKESGKQLLDRIIEERNAKALAEWEEALKKNPKAKKPVAVVASEIEDDEIPFEVPESWCWCHLGEICNEIKRGKSPKYVDRSDYLAFAQKCNVKTGGIDLSLALYLDEKSIDRYSEEDNLIQGDVVINSTGGGTMGRVGYYETKVPEGIKGVYPDSHVTVIRSIGNINQHYLYYILKHNQPVLEDCGTGSTNQTELKPAVLANFVIPLPPLEEQEEIVKKVEELLPLCK